MEPKEEEEEEEEEDEEETKIKNVEQGNDRIIGMKQSTYDDKISKIIPNVIKCTLVRTHLGIILAAGP